MPDITEDQALELMTKAVREQFDADELLEIHNELFPNTPRSEQEARTDPRPIIARLVEHIHSGLAIDLVVALWRLLFIRHRNVWYNEEEDLIHYDVAEEVATME